MKNSIEYDTQDPYSVDYAMYHLHRKWPEICDFLFYLTHALFDSDSECDVKIEALVEKFDKLNIYNDLMTYKLALNLRSKKQQLTQTKELYNI